METELDQLPSAETSPAFAALCRADDIAPPQGPHGSGLLLSIHGFHHTKINPGVVFGRAHVRLEFLEGSARTRAGHEIIGDNRVRFPRAMEEAGEVYMLVMPRKYIGGMRI